MEPLELPDHQELTQHTPAEIWSIGGGKGGVGKSLVTLSLAYWLGRLKRQIITIDADLGGANLHTMLGMRIPESTLDDFLLRRVDSMEEIVLKTRIPNVRLIAGGSEIPALANPNYGQKNRILKAIHKLEADYLLVDLGAGASLNTLDFFLSSPNKLVVMTPQPTSIQNAYGFIKAALYRRIGRILRPTPLRGLLDSLSTKDGGTNPQSSDEILEEVSITCPELLGEVHDAMSEMHIQLVVNMVRNPQEEKVGEVVSEVCHRFLGIKVSVLGMIPYDPTLERWATIMNGTGFGAEGSSGEALRAAYEIAYTILNGQMLRRVA